MGKTRLRDVDIPITLNWYMQKMLGTFDLKAGETQDAFHRAFDDMARHLHGQRLLENRLYLTRSEHQGYDRSPAAQTPCRNGLHVRRPGAGLLGLSGSRPPSSTASGDEPDGRKYQICPVSGACPSRHAVKPRRVRHTLALYQKGMQGLKTRAAKRRVCRGVQNADPATACCRQTGWNAGTRWAAGGRPRRGRRPSHATRPWCG